MFLSTRFGHKIVLLEATLYRRAIENNYVEAGMAVAEYIRTKRRKRVPIPAFCHSGNHRILYNKL